MFSRRLQQGLGDVNSVSQTWISGAAGSEAANGSFGTWRGRPVEIGGTWMDTNATTQIQGPSWSVGPGAQWGQFTGCMDIAPGAIWLADGESWANAASGSYDTRWTTFWTNLKNNWSPRDPSKLYVRFAHEYNLTGNPWTVTPANVTNFVTAWRRWHAIKQTILPLANLTWCPNAGNSYQSSYDIRTSYPGDDYVDVIAVDWYNNWPWVNSAADFQTKIQSMQSFGAPQGIEKWRQYALSRGKPMAISEWSSAANPAGAGGGGDAPVFMEQLYAWISQNAGHGPGQLKYEVLFNIAGYNDSYKLYPTTDQPLAAARYAQLW